MTEIDWKRAEAGLAYFSDDRVYRYALSRDWAGHGDAACLIIGLNPSTANEQKLDPTLRRCVRFAAREGYSGFWMGNLFAYRATDPRDMKAATDPIGPDNDSWLLRMASWVGRGNVIAAWGAHGDLGDRDKDVKRLLRDYDLRCFGLTKHGHPKHPLYLPSSTPLVAFA